KILFLNIHFSLDALFYVHRISLRITLSSSSAASNVYKRQDVKLKNQTYDLMNAFRFYLNDFFENFDMSRGLKE
ncbi:hypothetical protein ACISNY_09010, partial [Campylobacter jejuni]